MTFSFTEKPFSSRFAALSFPKLVSVCKVEKSHTGMPRLMHRHHDRLEILLIFSGQGKHVIGDTSYDTAQGDVLIYNSGVLHDEQANAGGNMGVFCLTVTDLKLPGRAPNRLVPDTGRAVLHTGPAYDEVFQLCGMIHQHTLRKDFRYEEVTNYLLRTLIVLLDGLIHQEETSVPSGEHGVGARIKEHIDDHYTEDLDLTSIAKDLGMNPFHVSHVFKKTFGFSPMQYVIRRRMGEAQSLLINSTLEVTRIATQVGYNNLSHFQNAFVKIVGMPPGKYRKHWNDRQ